DAILELGNDLAAAIVGGRVGREEDQHVDVELHGIATNLDVALFQNVEEPDLDQLIQLRYLIHGKDPAVHAWDEAEVESFFCRHAGTAGELGRIDFADDVRELGAGGEALGITLLAWPPGDRDFLLRQLGHHLFTDLGDRAEWVVVYRGRRLRHVGNLFVQKTDQATHQAALGLPFFAEEEQIVPGNQSEIDLRDDRVFVADDSGE